MNLTFKLTDETKINWLGETLFRIEAVVDIPARGVKKGDKGGWLESEKVNGDAWVSGDARVYGNALVYGASLNAKKVFTKGKFVGRSDGNEEKLTVLHREACSNWDNTYVLGDYEISDIEEKEEPKDEEIIELNGKKYKLLEQS